MEFIGVGVTKGGSAWLADMLAAHPDICLAEPKDVRYFNPASAPGGSERNPNRDEGQGWYHKRFSHCSDSAVRGEYTPMYMADPRTIDNIHTYNPDAKLIVSLRNPVDRLIAHYRMNRNYIGRAKLPIEQEIQADARYLLQGLYGQQLEYLYSKFSRDQVLVIFIEDIRADRIGTVEKLYRFLGVNSNYQPGGLNENSNETRQARCPWAGKKLKLPKTLLSLLTRKSDNLILPEDFRQELGEYYREDISILEQITGRDLSEWLS